MRIGSSRHGLALKLAAGAVVLGAGVTGALAAGVGQPEPWQMDMQVPVTDIGRSVYNFHWWINLIMMAVAVFVAGLILAVIVKYNHRANPTPSRTTHNTTLEVAWTLVPVLILVMIAIPSFRVLRAQLSDPKADMVLKVIGHAWYWEYEYPADQGGGFKFEQRIVADANDQSKAKPGPNGEPRNLAVDEVAVVPVNKLIKVQVTSADVLHNFTVPSFGFKMDAVPGRLNQIWFKAEREGIYFGQCSELCGTYHAFMPIAIRVVSEAQYAQWLDESKRKFAGADGATRLAAN